MITWSLSLHIASSFPNESIRLRCLCPCHVCPKLPLVRLGSPVHDEETVVSSSIELSQNYRMSFQLESNFTADPESVQRCVELLDDFQD